MKNYVQNGEVITVIAPYDVASGEGVLVGSIFGVAQHAATAGAKVAIARRGVFKHAKTNAQAWAVGDQIYWDDANRAFTTTSTNNTLVGSAIAAAANPSPTGTVLLDGAVR